MHKEAANIWVKLALHCQKFSRNLFRKLIKNMKKIFYFALVFLFNLNIAQAQIVANEEQGEIISDKDLQLFKPKKPTPSRFFAADISMPDNFSKSNNLAKKVGSFYRAFGEVIFVQGTVSDSFGLPISGAIIEIWQTNSAGKYHSLLDKNNEFVDKYFNMSGRTTTDNLGNYSFITIMPGANPGRAPHINMNIFHPKFGKLETEMYFEKHPFNDSDYQYLSYNYDDRTALTATVVHSEITNTKSIKICTFNIVMKGIHQYKRN